MTRRLNDAMFLDCSGNEFRSISKEILENQNVSGFESDFAKMKTFIRRNDDRRSLTPWLKWWVSRKEHIFRAFKNKTAPYSNLSEVVTPVGSQLNGHISLSTIVPWMILLNLLL